ncbi:CatB-related O-acetyltransferase [Clostridium sp. C8-1-8]|uniref:CatB-related O-acetyltransferase n=1 Tax=Clostridium sp. C8-1-8 TaxID=2698831 RepID=UPI00136ED0BA|nr:CatB-related O-acetyltransferase [Clostridium sp. C8-1-8]
MFSLVINSKLDKNVAIKRMTVFRNSSISEYSYIANNCTINNCNIGKFCSIAPFVKIGFGSHPTTQLSTSPVFYSNKNPIGVCFNSYNYTEEFKHVEIGNDVWIGTGVIILDGVKVGNGAIIGAGAVVTKDIPDYAIAVGVPAKVIKYRFKEEIVRLLSDEQWWNKNIDDYVSNFINLTEATVR